MGWTFSSCTFFFVSSFRSALCNRRLLVLTTGVTFSGSTDGFSLCFERLRVRVSCGMGVLTLSFEIARGFARTSVDLEFFTRLTTGSGAASGMVRFRDDRWIGSVRFSGTAARTVGTFRSVRFFVTTAGTVGGF